MVDEDNSLFAIRIIAKNLKGVLRDISTIVARHDANIVMTHQEIFDSGPLKGLAELYIEYQDCKDPEAMIEELGKIPSVQDVHPFEPFSHIYGTRVIIIGGGAQVAQVALGAVNEADRHNIRGERISVDTIPLVGEKTVAQAVDAVARLPRAAILVMAGSLMGGEISKAVDRVKEAGIPVIALKMAGSVPDHADMVVTDPIQAGVFAVMHVSKKAVFDITRVRGREF
jgi:energy-converting hydrogenase B subunit Q